MGLRAFADAWRGDEVNEILETSKNIAGHECWLSCFGERWNFHGGVECHYVLGEGPPRGGSGRVMPWAGGPLHEPLGGA